MTPPPRNRRPSAAPRPRRALARPAVVPLEDRTLLSTVTKIADFRASGGSAPASITPLGGYVFFSADDGTTGRELWRYDPAGQSARRVLDINPGAAGSIDAVDEPFTTLGGQLYFVAADASGGRELWRHDPSINLTTRVADIRPGAAGSDVDTLFPMGGKLYFAADDGTSGNELWQYNPVTGITSRVADIRAGASGSFPTGFAELGGQLYFGASDGLSGTELWRYNPTTGTTGLVADIAPASADSTPTQLFALDGKLYFSADDGFWGRELWKYDPATSSASLVFDLNAGGSSTPLQFVSTGNRLYFRADDGTSGREMYVYEPATNSVGGIGIGAGSLSAYGLGDQAPVIINGKLYFAADDGSAGKEIYRFDPATLAVSSLADINLGPNVGSNPSGLRAVGGQLFFTANEGAFGFELYRYDPATGTLSLDADINPGGSSGPHGFAELNGVVYFAANDGTSGEEFWADDPRPAPVVSVAGSTVTEGQQALVTVTLSRPSIADTTVTIRTVNSSATSGTDFNGFSLGFPILIPAGSTTGSRSINTIDDTSPEPAETFSVNISSAPGLTIGNGTTTVTILDNDAPVANFTLAAQTVSESVGHLSVGVILDRPAPSDLSIPVSFGSFGAPGQPADLTLDSTTVFIPAGSTTGTLGITIINDSLDEITESRTILLVAIGQVAVGNQNAFTLSILDDDPPPTVAFATSMSTLPEGSPTFLVTARLSEVSGADVLVPVSYSGSASRGNDYTAFPSGLRPDGAILIPAGQLSGNIAITIIDDTAPEATESVFIAMGTPVNALPSAAVGASLGFALTIPANDAPTATFASSSFTLGEGSSASLVVRLSEASPLDITIPLIPGGPAGYPSDFQLSATSIVIPHGQLTGSVLITATNDAVAEPQETFTVRMGTLINAQPGATPQFTGAIHANDLPTISFDTAISKVWEDTGTGDTILTISASLSNPSSTPISVPITVVGAGGLPGPTTTADYAFSDAVFDFPGDSTSRTATVRLAIKKDAINEPTENFTIKFFALPGLVNLSASQGSHTISIYDNDPLVSLRSYYPTQQDLASLQQQILYNFFAFPGQQVDFETTQRVDVGEGRGTFSQGIYLSAPSNLPVTVPIAYAGKATKGTDYNGPATVTIPAGQAGSTLDLSILQNAVIEDSQSFTATIGAPRAGDNFIKTSNPTQLLVNIADDDVANVNFSATSKSVGEAAGTVSVTVSLSARTEIPITIPITITGTATIGSDYVLSSPALSSGKKFNLTIPANPTGTPSATVSIRVLNDTVWNEPAIETVTLTLGSGTDVTPGSRKAYTLSITNDDAQPVSRPAATAGTVAIDTGGTGTILANPGSYSPTTLILNDPVTYYPAGTIALSLGAGGYVDGGFAFFDANTNGVFDFLDLDGDGVQGPGEPSDVGATTRPDGRFAILISEEFDRDGDGRVSPDEGQMVLIGGTDRATGTALNGRLIAPAGSYVVSPFTTMMASLVSDQGMTLDQAADRVKEALGLPEGAELLRTDPIADAQAGGPIGQAIFAADSKLMDSVRQVQGLIAGASPVAPTAFLQSAIYADLAAKIAEAGSTLDLATPGVVESVIQGASFRTGTPLDPAAIQGAAEVIAAGNRQIDAVATTAGEAFLDAMSRAQIVAQGAVAARLEDLGAGRASVADVLASGSGQALADQIAATAASELVPSSISIASVRRAETDSGDAIFEFAVTLNRPSDRPISVLYESADLTAIAGVDYAAASGQLAWAAGDASQRIIQVLVRGDTTFEGDEEFLLSIYQAENAVIAQTMAVGSIADDDPFSYAAPAGEGGNDLVLTVDGGHIGLERNGEVVFDGILSSPGPITIVGADGVANTLTVNVLDAGAAGFPGIVFQGGNLATDRLDVVEGLARLVVNAPGLAGTGTVTVDGLPITYSGVEAITDLVASGVDGVTSVAPEGSALSFQARPADPDASSLTYAWTLTRNGQSIATGTGRDLSVAAGDDGDYSVTLTTKNTQNGAVGVAVRTFLVTNAPPTARPDVISTDEDRITRIDVLANDDDPADPLTVVGVTQGAHGQVIINPDGTLTYTPAANYSGPDSFGYVIDDGEGGRSSATVSLIVAAVADRPAVTASTAGGSEGAAFPVNLSAAPVDLDGSEQLVSIRVSGVPAGARFNRGTLAGTVGGLGVWDLSPADLAGLTLTVPDGPASLTLSVTVVAREASNGSTDEDSTPLTFNVANVAPKATLTGPASGTLAAVGQAITFTATFTDPALANDAYAANWKFTTTNASGQVVTVTPGSLSVTVTPPTASAPGTITARVTFSQAGVYRASMALTDGDGGQDVASQIQNDAQSPAMVVVYDPSAGFVTGGGWLHSPAGAYLTSPSTSGSALFGFVSKYLKGSNQPSGATDFAFAAGRFNFLSLSYDWLVVSGAQAQYRGTGLFNASPGYRFALTALDGRLAGDGVDRMRLRIWSNAGTLVYDNQPGAADDARPTTPISGGSIVIHTNGQAMLAAPAAAPPGRAPSPTLDPVALASAIEHARADWIAVRPDAATRLAIEQTRVEAASLSGDLLGSNDPAHRTIWIDVDGAGRGWGGPGGYDLETVVAHEFGHILGLDHDEPDSGRVMEPVLAPGEQFIPAPASIALLTPPSALVPPASDAVDAVWFDSRSAVRGLEPLLGLPDEVVHALALEWLAPRSRRSRSIDRR